MVLYTPRISQFRGTSAPFPRRKAGVFPPLCSIHLKQTTVMISSSGLRIYYRHSFPCTYGCASSNAAAARNTGLHHIVVPQSKSLQASHHQSTRPTIPARVIIDTIAGPRNHVKRKRRAFANVFSQPVPETTTRTRAVLSEERLATTLDCAHLILVIPK